MVLNFASIQLFRLIVHIFVSQIVFRALDIFTQLLAPASPLLPSARS
jgi:hypothetical protein